MKHTLQIESGGLRVTMAAPGSDGVNQRFDAAGMITSVLLHDRYEFCTPEQVLPGRETCGGAGLCSEFVWDELGEEVPAGQWFPKLGVGLVRQKPGGGPYAIYETYPEVQPFTVECEVFADRAVFLTRPKECLGIAVRTRKQVWIEAGALHMETGIENVGRRRVTAQEYVHNFVSLNGLSTGPGYVLQLPYDGNIAAIETSAYPWEHFDARTSGFQYAKGDTIRWHRAMDGYAFHKTTQEKDILPCDVYEWTLRHEESPLWIREKSGFRPAKLVVWGVEHCICPEVFASIDLQPGAAMTFHREWNFGNGGS